MTLIRRGRLGVWTVLEMDRDGVVLACGTARVTSPWAGFLDRWERVVLA